jgi:hypothetical protein
MEEARPFKFNTDKGYYPIVYVRGYAMTRSEREETFHDTYYGFAATSVEKRQVPKGKDYLVADVFEGQLIRFMKNKDYGYADAANRGLIDFHSNPTRSIWISRFYDTDYIKDRVRSIEDHAEELADLIINQIPERLKNCGVDESAIKDDYKVILIAHSMGGLVCRTLIQNILADGRRTAAANTILAGRPLDAKSLIHRLVTIGTPHKGIDLGRLPDYLEDTLVSALNPFDSSMFKEKRMREYLRLGAESEHDLHSLGDCGYPVKRCLCMIGSDYNSYGAVKNLTGSFSDGLVKQDRAYIVSGSKPDGPYADENTAFYANVHRAHSGYRGIVNSYETYENIQRFLFGDMMVRISLADVNIISTEKENITYYYDFEFSLSIRGTGVYLHRREQDPCENAIRFDRDKIPASIHLHTGFLNSRLKITSDGYSYFLMKFSVLEYRKEEGFLWDYKYPSRQIYTESLEIRISDAHEAQYRWLSDLDTWTAIEQTAGLMKLPLRNALALNGNVVLEAWDWPNKALTLD